MLYFFSEEVSMAIQLVDFYADWCGPCIVMKPVIDEIEKELAGKIEVKKINVDENQYEANKYGVMSIPTYLVLKDGKEVERFVGAQSKEIMKNKIFQHSTA
ncbi:MAG: thioredoxin [Candidatus Woykebacteria bacterium RIFCSPLOWO2_01_FULL_41_12]|uniref:Thioredoxin n=1 Tax=Candidatus Woykebacteria bacterium RIFCSPLOWO2_01_FULL_41_12 TaxID=1802604 RepID=A0A1G1WTR8_9BACT|nr:MAG: thioredoxin [Candidatus Woykebacteria bacterium RIFCSPLOWO2_01_FULL_41_12]